MKNMPMYQYQKPDPKTADHYTLNTVVHIAKHLNFRRKKLSETDVFLLGTVSTQTNFMRLSYYDNCCYTRTFILESVLFHENDQLLILKKKVCMH